MLCQKCHKNLATARYAEVIDGQVKELQMCSTCLDAQDSEGASGFELSGEAPVPKRVPKRRAKRSEKFSVSVVCESCGTESSEILQDNTIGCAVCYDTFKDELEGIIRERHVAHIHRGKAPHRDDVREQIRVELQSKRALLRSALKSERYEEAASLRDEIHSLESRLGVMVPE